MAYCGKCGSAVEDNVKFCPACGASTELPKDESTRQTDYAAKLQNLNNTTDSTAQFDAADIQQNKVMAILAYIGPLVFVSIFAAKGSKFARYHSNQGLILLIASAAWGVAYGILSAVLLAISWRLYFITGILGIVSLVFIVPMVLGIINAANGRAKELPIIGKFRLLK